MGHGQRPFGGRGTGRESWPDTSSTSDAPLGGAGGEGVVAGGRWAGSTCGPGPSSEATSRAVSRRSRSSRDRAGYTVPGSDVGEPELVEALDHLVAVRLPLGEQVEQQEGEHALQELRIVVGGHVSRLCLVLGNIN